MIESWRKLITHTFKINNITIIPISDCHIGAVGFKEKELKTIIKYIADTPNVYCTLGGDILDNAVLTGKNLGVFDSTQAPLLAIDYAAKLFEPIKHKILAGISGNHEERSEKATTLNPMHTLMLKLQLEHLYRGKLAVIKIQLGSRCNNEGIGKRQTYTILLHHGTGTAESAIKKDMDFIKGFDGADIICTGHTHMPRIAPFPIEDINKQSDIITPRDAWIVVSNAFLDADYALGSMKTSTSTVPVIIDIYSGKQKQILVQMGGIKDSNGKTIFL